MFLAASLVVPGNAAHYPGVQATPQGSAFSQRFPGTYLFPGLTASILQSSWPQGGTCFMLPSRDRKDKKGPLPQSTDPSSLGEVWN